MKVQVNPAEMPEENCKFRKELRKKLGIIPYLKTRNVFRVGLHDVHCELYEYSPDAPTIIFLPGIGTYSELYAELLSKLMHNGYNLVGIDLPGHGYSAGSRGDYTVAQVCAAVTEVLDVLQQRYTGKFGIYGYSIGALLAVAAAEQDSRLSAVLCETLLLPDLAPDMSYRMGWMWTWASSLMLPGFKLPLESFLNFEQLLANHPAADMINQDPLLVFNYSLQTLSSLFSQHCKITEQKCDFAMALLHGEQDEILDLDYSKRIIQYCTHPIELLIIKNYGHMAPFIIPDQVAKQAAQWFKQVLPN